VEIDMRTGKPVGSPDVPQPTPDAQPEQPDGQEGAEAAETAEGEPGSAPEEIGGMPVDDVLEALRTGILPAELLESLSIVGTYNGEEEIISLADARDGRLRELDYSRKTQEAAEKRKEAEHLAQSALQTFDQWRDQSIPVQDRVEQFEAIVGEDQAMEFAGAILERWQLEQDMKPEMREYVQRARRQARDAKFNGEQVRESLSQAVQSPEADPQQQKQQRDMIRRHFTESMKALGLPNTPEVKDLFRAHLPSFWDQQGPLEARHIRSTLAAVKQRLREMGHTFSPARQAVQQRQQQQAPTAPRTPAPLPARAESTGGGGAPPEQMRPTVDNFRKLVQQRRKGLR
jgi:hypothetical protein